MPLGERKITSSREVAKPYLLPEDGKVIIAMKGLPCTAKSEIAMRIGQWARCPVLSVDDFLDAVSLEKGYNAESLPSMEEAERFRLLALYALYKMAHRHLDSYTCVVIKSRLCSSFELDLLMWLVEENECANLIVVECRMRNEYRFRSRLEDIVETSRNKEFGSKVNTTSRSRELIMKDLEKHRLSHIATLGVHLEWYKARSWKDVENAKEDWLDDQDWDDHLLCLINDNVSCPRFVSRLVVDPFDDLDLHIGTRLSTLPSDFLHVISHLLDRWYKDRHVYCSEEDEDKDSYSDEDRQSRRRSRYLITEFNELRRFLVKEELRSSIYKVRSNKHCTTDGDNCVFKYHKRLQLKEAYDCGVCQERVEPGDQAYTCHFCTLTLHKLCAKTLDSNYLEHIHNHPDGFFFFNYSEELANLRDKTACETCNARDNGFSRECASCLFETHLKLRLLPTIIDHDGHKHLLSIQFKPDSLIGPEYGCFICKFRHPMDLFLMPGEVTHEHGGYEHVMKLTYAHRHDDDVMEPEDDYWCNVCYGEMDPQPWFYYCRDCPYYITHLYCAGKKSIQEAVRNRNLAIRQCEVRCNFDKDMIVPADDHISWAPSILDI